MTDALAPALADALRDRYTIERELGRGGMATVYLARDLKHDRPVALKVLRPELSAILGAERFPNEIRLTAQLQHPHILTLIDSGEAAGLLYYVMPYVEGESLRARLQREGQLPLGDTIGVTRAVAAALDYAHGQGVIHRDIKPENILLQTTVVMEGDRIVSVGPAGATRIPPNAEVIDAAGKLLLPGLWDMHVHVSPGEDGLLHVAAGVTSARDLGNDTAVTARLRRRFASDSPIGPRLSLGGIIDGPGPYQVPIGMFADDAETARQAVDWYAARGYEQVKIYSSIKPELVPVVVAAAHAKGLRVSGHVPASMRAEEVVRLGFEEIQHANMLALNFMDTVPCVQAGYQFASRGGFTTMLSLGLGYAPGVPEGESGFGALANLGLGYTWRRSARN